MCCVLCCDWWLNLLFLLLYRLCSCPSDAAFSADVLFELLGFPASVGVGCWFIVVTNYHLVLLLPVLFFDSWWWLNLLLVCCSIDAVFSGAALFELLHYPAAAGYCWELCFYYFCACLLLRIANFFLRLGPLLVLVLELNTIIIVVSKLKGSTQNFKSECIIGEIYSIYVA